MSRIPSAALSRALPKQTKLQVLARDLALSDNEATDVQTVATPLTAPIIKTVPGIGTLIQRSDRQHAEKMAWLTTPPPPLPKLRKPPATKGRPQAPATTTSAPLWPPKVAARQAERGSPTPEIDLRRLAKQCVNRLTPLTPSSTTATMATPTDPQLRRALGPGTPAPIRMELEAGLTADVPYFAAHVARKYKLRAGGAHWILRFDRQGQLRTCKRHSGAS